MRTTDLTIDQLAELRKRARGVTAIYAGVGCFPFYWGWSLINLESDATLMFDIVWVLSTWISAIGLAHLLARRYARASEPRAAILGTFHAALSPAVATWVMGIPMLLWEMLTGTLPSKEELFALPGVFGGVFIIVFIPAAFFGAPCGLHIHGWVEHILKKDEATA